MRHFKTAFIGFGYRGKQMLRLLRTIDFFDIVGIADKNECFPMEKPLILPCWQSRPMGHIHHGIDLPLFREPHGNDGAYTPQLAAHADATVW